MDYPGLIRFAFLWSSVIRFLPSKITYNFLNQGCVDFLTPLFKAYQQVDVAGDIDFTEDALGEFPNQLSVGFQKLRAIVVGHNPAVLNILIGLFFLKRICVGTDADPLGELAKFRRGQFGLQLRLGGKFNLNQIVFGCLQVGIQPQVFHGPDVEILGFELPELDELVAEFLTKKNI